MIPFGIGRIKSKELGMVSEQLELGINLRNSWINGSYLNLQVKAL